MWPLFHPPRCTAAKILWLGNALHVTVSRKYVVVLRSVLQDHQCFILRAVPRAQPKAE